MVIPIMIVPPVKIFSKTTLKYLFLLRSQADGCNFCNPEMLATLPINPIISEACLLGDSILLLLLYHFFPN